VLLPRRLAVLAIAGALATSLAACGDDDDDSAGAATDTAAPTSEAATDPADTTAASTADTDPVETTTTEAAPETTEAASETTAAAVETTVPAEAGAFEGDAADAAVAWSTVFDSTVPFADKASHLEAATDLEATHAAYVATGEQLGGIQLAPTAVDVVGDVATVTYDILFAEQVAYADQTGEIGRVDGTWVVSRDAFCSFMATARTPCP
jgi:iron complex transport system substrate-binding protein